MATDKKEAKTLWIGWTHDAISRYAIPDEVEDAVDLVEDMVDVATKYADAMMDEFSERFSGGPRRKRKRPEPEDEEDDDPEDEEDE